MKSFRSTLILAIIVALVVGYAYVFEYKKPQEEKVAEEEKQKIFKVKEEEISAIALKWAGADTRLEKVNDQWLLKAPLEDETDASAMGTLTKAIAEETSKALVSDDPNVDLKIYGLDDPLGTITVKNNQGKDVIVDIGQVEGLGGTKYALLRDEKKVVVVDSGIQHKLAKTARDLRDKRVLRIPFNDPVESMKITWADKSSGFSIGLKKKDTTWVYEDKPWSVDQRVAAAFVGQLEGLRTNEFMQELKTDPAAKRKYRLDLVLAKFELSTRGGKTDTVYYHGVEGGKAYLTAASKNTIYQLLPNSIEPLRIKPDHFRDKKGPFQFNKDKVEKIEVRTDLVQLKLIKEGQDWKEEKPDPKFNVDQAQVNQLIDSVQTLSVSEFLGEAKKKEFSQALGTVVFSNKEGVELELKWGRELSAQDRLVVTNKSNEAVAVAKATIGALPLQTLRQQKEENKPK